MCLKPFSEQSIRITKRIATSLVVEWLSIAIDHFAGRLLPKNTRRYKRLLFEKGELIGHWSQSSIELDVGKQTIFDKFTCAGGVEGTRCETES